MNDEDKINWLYTQLVVKGLEVQTSKENDDYKKGYRLANEHAMTVLRAAGVYPQRVKDKLQTLFERERNLEKRTPKP